MTHTITTTIPIDRFGITADSNDEPHIIINTEDEALRYLTKSGQLWQSVNLGHAASDITDPVVDQSGTLSFVFHNDKDLSLLRYVSGSAQVTELPTACAAQNQQLKFFATTMSSIKSAIVYGCIINDAGLVDIYTMDSSASWASQKIEQSAKEYVNASIALDTGGNLAVAYGTYNNFYPVLRKSQLYLWQQGVNNGKPVLMLDYEVRGFWVSITLDDLQFDSADSLHFLYTLGIGAGTTISHDLYYRSSNINGINYEIVDAGNAPVGGCSFYDARLVFKQEQNIIVPASSVRYTKR